MDDKRVYCNDISYGYAISMSPFFNFSDTCKFIFIRLSRSTLLPRAVQIIFVHYLGLQLRERHLGFLFLLLAIISPLPSSSLPVEELRGFKFAPLRGMQREIEIRGWYDKVIRKKRTAQNKRIIMYKRKKVPRKWTLWRRRLEITSI